MLNSPIVDKVHRIREQLLAKFDGDLHALARDLQRKTEQAKAAGQAVIARPPRKPSIDFSTETNRAPLDLPGRERNK
jgi:hypothetical protein